MRLGQMSLDDAAKVAAGNWHKFPCFVLRREREDGSEIWAIIYTHDRDSGLLDQSNANAIRKALEPYTEGDDPDVVFESHSHSEVGHINGFSVRVNRDGEITKAFKAYYKLSERMSDYPILDEADYSNRKYEATLTNLPQAAWRLKYLYDLPDGWDGEVYSWLAENRCSSIEDCDDQGGFPNEDDLEAAFTSLGYQKTE